RSRVGGKSESARTNPSVPRSDHPRPLPSAAISRFRGRKKPGNDRLELSPIPRPFHSGPTAPGGSGATAHREIGELLLSLRSPRKLQRDGGDPPDRREETEIGR